MRILLTGAAGFIGSWTAEELIRQGHKIVGVDNFNDYYNPSFKRENVKGLKARIFEGDVRDGDFLERISKKKNFDAIIHLAAMVGVRPSIEQPLLYEDVNVRGTLNILEFARRN